MKDLNDAKPWATAGLQDPDETVHNWRALPWLLVLIPKVVWWLIMGYPLCLNWGNKTVWKSRSWDDT